MSCLLPGRFRPHDLTVVESYQTEHIRSMEAIMPTQSVRQSTLAQRLREIRVELFGLDGVPLLAEALHLSTRTWRSYEAGANIPAKS